jgi:hypothetical protein
VRRIEISHGKTRIYLAQRNKDTKNTKIGKLEPQRKNLSGP